MSARAKAPKAVEAWAILGSTGDIVPHLIYADKRRANQHAKVLSAPRAIRVLITPAPRRSKP